MWLNPLRLVRPRITRDWVPTMFAFAWLLGRIRRRDEWTEQRMATVLRAVQPSALAARRGRVLAALGLLVVVDLVAMQRLDVPTDHFAVAIAATAFLFRPNLTQRAKTLLVELVLACVVFILVSHVFTVAKASVFLLSPPRDQLIIDLETALFGGPLHVHVADLAASSRPLAELLDGVYMSVFEHMIAASIFLGGLRDRRQQVELLAALTLSYLIGGLAYHLLPSIGPVFVAERPRFDFLLDDRLETFHAVKWLRSNNLWITTGAATVLQPYSYVAAMPSLHPAHEVVMVWYARSSRGMLAFALAFATLTVLATLGLGWHYASDLVGGTLLAALVIFLARRFGGSILPERFDRDDPPPRERPPLRELARRLRAARCAVNADAAARRTST
jgi:membrane-associated phospholipid phosphatase